MDGQDRIIYAQTGRGERIGTARDRIPALKSNITLLRWLELTAHKQDFQFDWHVQGYVPAEINHGRWIVRCPFCSGAEEADPLQPVFFCLSCGNFDNQSHVMGVLFPADLGAIELELRKRNDIANRNWLPTETLDDIMKENKAHGLDSASH